jgi:hypothetical protein
MDDLWYVMGGLALKAISCGHHVIFVNTVIILLASYQRQPVHHKYASAIF